MKSAETSSRNLNQTSPERLDHSIWLVAFALMGLGLVLVYSASFIFAEEKFGDALYFFKRQTAFVVVSLGLLGVASHFPYRLLQKFFWVFYAAMIAGLLATFIPGLAHRAGGASRWIALPMGFRLEPAEYVKLFAPVVFGWLLTRETKKTDPWWKSPAINLGLVLLPAFLMLKQPDFGSTVLFFAVGFAMLFCFGLPWKYIFSAAVVSVPLFYVLVMRVAYRRDRVLAFLNPWADPTHSGFQVIQSLLSLHAGGLFGAGLGKGQAKLFFLPEAHTDFILAVLGEETGFIGLVLVFLLFGWLIFRALQISYRCKEPFGQKLSLGLGALLAFQVVVNAGVVMGLLPTKGLTMPFLSYGGSSLVATSLACGILVNIHRNGKKV